MPDAETIVDTHVHVACADTTAHPRRLSGVGSAWWSEPTGSAEAVFASARACNVGHVVVVQAVGAYGTDWSCAAEAAAGSEGYASLVVALDMQAPRPADTAPECQGWRLFGVVDGAPWLDDDRADSVWEDAWSDGIVLVPTIFTERLDSLRRTIERNPPATIALDHCAFPDMADDGDLLVRALADLDTVRLKVSTHVLAAWDQRGALDAQFEALVEAFGAHRLCWGSDHPQHQGPTYADKLALARRAARNLDPRQRASFFAGTATELGWT